MSVYELPEQIDTIVQIFQDADEYSLVNILRELYKFSSGEGGVNERTYIDMRDLWDEVDRGWQNFWEDNEVREEDRSLGYILTNSDLSDDSNLKKLLDFSIGEELRSGERGPAVVVDFLEDIKSDYKTLIRSFQTAEQWNVDIASEDRDKMFRRMIGYVQGFSLIASLYDSIISSTRTPQEIFFNPLHRLEESRAFDYAVKKVPNYYLG